MTQPTPIFRLLAILLLVLAGVAFQATPATATIDCSECNCATPCDTECSFRGQPASCAIFFCVDNCFPPGGGSALEAEAVDAELTLAEPCGEVPMSPAEEPASSAPALGEPLEEPSR